MPFETQVSSRTRSGLRFAEQGRLIVKRDGFEHDPSPTGTKSARNLTNVLPKPHS